MAKPFYTPEQKEALNKLSKNSRGRGMTEAMGARMLDALGEQQNTLQSIEMALREISRMGSLSKQCAIEASNKDAEKSVERIIKDRSDDFSLLEFQEKKVTRIAFAKTKEMADELGKKLGLKICYPSDVADFGDGCKLYVLADY